MSSETMSQVIEAMPQARETIQQTFLLTIDWNEVILLIIGAVIGLMASLATIVIQRHLDQKGKLNIFTGLLTKEVPMVEDGDLKTAKMVIYIFLFLLCLNCKTPLIRLGLSEMLASFYTETAN